MLNVSEPEPNQHTHADENTGDYPMRIPFLTSVAVEPTNDCNWNCTYCHRKDRPIGYMPVDFFKYVISQIPWYCRVGLSFGGESMMHPQFREMVAYASRKSFRDLNVASNGTFQYPQSIRVIQFPKPPPEIITRDMTLEDPLLRPTVKWSYCHFLYRYLAVLWNGDVVPCCHDVAGTHVMGNLHDSDLHHVWHNQRYKDLRKRGKCPGCEVYKYGDFRK